MLEENQIFWKESKKFIMNIDTSGSSYITIADLVIILNLLLALYYSFLHDCANSTKGYSVNIFGYTFSDKLQQVIINISVLQFLSPVIINYLQNQCCLVLRQSQSEYFCTLAYFPYNTSEAEQENNQQKLSVPSDVCTYFSQVEGFCSDLPTNDKVTYQLSNALRQCRKLIRKFKETLEMLAISGKSLAGQTYSTKNLKNFNCKKSVKHSLSMITSHFTPREIKNVTKRFRRLITMRSFHDGISLLCCSYILNER